MCVTNRMHIISLIRISYENSNSNTRTQTDYMYMYKFSSKAYIAETLYERWQIYHETASYIYEREKLIKTN